MKVCCVFSLELPQWGDSNEYTQYTVFNIKKNITIIYPKFAARGLKNELQIAVVNEPSVFEPLKFYCIKKLREGNTLIMKLQNLILLKRNETILNSNIDFSVQMY